MSTSYPFSFLTGPTTNGMAVHRGGETLGRRVSDRVGDVQGVWAAIDSAEFVHVGRQDGVDRDGQRQRHL